MKLTILLIGGISILYVYLMQFIDHKNYWIPYIVVLLALIKTVYFTFFTFMKADRIIKYCHSFKDLLWVFCVLVVLIVFSFAVDFTCLSFYNPMSFDGIDQLSNRGYLYNLYQSFYLSLVTFTSIGYGDIVPISSLAKLLVMMEILILMVV